MNTRTGAEDSSDARRWRLMATLARDIGARKAGPFDYRSLAATSATLIAEEIGDRVLVLLFDIPGTDGPIAEVAHRNPATLWETEQFLADLGDTGLREWAAQFSERIGRTHGTVVDGMSDPSAESPLLRRLRRHRIEAGISDVAYAPLRLPSGDLRGMVVCSRDNDSAPIDQFDHAALASAGDTITLELDLAITVAEKRQLSHQRRFLLEELVRAEQAERERIAQDVHDDSIQLLSAAQLRLQLLLGELEPDTASYARTDSALQLVYAAQTSLRNLLTDLGAGIQPGFDLVEALRRSASAFFNGTTTEATVGGSVDNAPHEVAAVLLRAGREAISNARQHAQAAHLDVALQTTPTHWVLSASDDGVGIPQHIPTRPGHLGLHGMVGRVAALGGRCTVARRPSGGTRVLIEIPRRG